MIYIKRFFSLLGIIITFILALVLSLISILTYPIQIMCLYIIRGDEAEIWDCTEIGKITLDWYFNHFDPE